MLDDLLLWEPLPPDVAEAPAWRPRTLDHATWPPDYKGVYAWRVKRLARIRNSAIDAEGRNIELFAAKAYYSSPEHAAEFIMDWMDTYNPRERLMKWRPFVFFKRQSEFITFLNELIAEQESGLVEKCRDVGLTWLCCGWSVWAWLFVPDTAIGWGSRKQDLVDKLGDLDSIFEKMRRLLNRIPKEFLPENYDASFMKFVNHDNGASITGEAGNNIGRGGRKTVYFKDESAHYEQPELIEASLGDNTNVQIDISSVNGLGNPFHRRREAGEDWYPGKTFDRGKVRVFIVDWRDHPEKDQSWYNRRRAKAMAEGSMAQFAQEVERNYSASVENTIIPLEWIQAAVDADIKLAHWTDDKKRPVDFRSGPYGAALDVADEGGDRNALSVRKGVVLMLCDEWGAPDIGVTTRKAIDILLTLKPLECQYDIVGMGSTVKAEYNRLVSENILRPGDVKMVPWNAGGGVLDPEYRVIPGDDDSAKNGDFFHNVKAQAWWALRMRFWRTFQAVTMGIRHDPADLIILDGDLPLIRQIEKELAQPTRGKSGSLKMIVDKKPDGTKSPNLADSIVMAYFPMPEEFPTAIFGSFGHAN